MKACEVFIFGGCIRFSVLKDILERYRIYGNISKREQDHLWVTLMNINSVREKEHPLEKTAIDII